MTKHFLLFALGLMMMALGVQQIQADGSFPENTIWSEDFESGVLPEGWIPTSANWSIDGGDHRDETTAFSGIKNLLYFYNGRGGVDTLYTATIDLSGYTNASLNFKFMNAQWEDDIDFLEVFYRNSPDESWTSLGGLIEAEHSDWTAFNFSLANVSSTFQLAFAAHSNYGYGVAIDDIYITGTALTPDPAGTKLTVFEGEGTNTSVPFYGFYGEEYLRAQYVIPADKLTKLKGKKINALRWYSARTDIPDYGDARIDVYLKEVYSPTLSNFVAKEYEDIVYHGEVILSYTADANGKLALTLVFEEDFVYFGGNLLVGCDNVEKGNWTSIGWYGQNVTNASVYGHSTSDISAITATQRNFIPQTTFFYEDAPQGATIKPIPDPAGTKLTVFEGEGTNTSVPFYGFYGEEYLRAQYVIPADKLTKLKGKKINALRWYSARTDIPDYGDARIDVYLKEVYSTTMSNFVAKEDEDIVYHGEVILSYTADANGKLALTLVFEEDFVYFGGNLLVGCDNVEKGYWSSIGWYGQNVTGASVYGHSTSDISAITATQSNFIPKTTFFYEDAPQGATIRPIPDPAGDQLTVFDGTLKSLYVPFNGIYAERYLRSQYLIPSDALTALEGKKINALRWYSTQTDILNFGDARIDVYLKEVDSTALRDFVEKADDDIVYHGNVVVYLTEDGKYALTLVLDKDFIYQGGNLLIGCDNVETGYWTAIYWYGQELENASVYGNSSSDISAITATQSNFIPKTTFFYEGGSEEEAIEGLQAEVEGSTVEISWNGEGDSFDLRYKPFSVNTGFEDGVLAPWTTIDADGDGYNWFMGNSGINYAHTGGGYAQSESYSNDLSAPLTPDNYLVSPKVQLGGSITFWAAAQDDNDYIEHFGVAVSTTSNTDPETFTTIQEWSTTDSRTYHQYTVDLSEYAGKRGYVAIRHFNSPDQFRLNIDDIEIEQPGVTIPESTDWTEVESIFSSPYTIENLEPGSYVLQVRAVEAGVPSNWSESVTFIIEASTGIESIVDSRESKVESRKILHEGHLFILRDGKIFNAQGARVK